MKTLTFEEALHPEAAGNYLQHVRGGEGTTVWGTVLHEAVHGEILLLAVAQEVHTDDNLAISSPSPPSLHADGMNNSASSPSTPASLGHGCFFLEGVIGWSLLVTAVVVAFSTELAASIVFIVASGVLATTEWLPLWLRAMFSLVIQILQTTDSLIMMIGVLATEIVGLVAMLVTSLIRLRCRGAGAHWWCKIRNICLLVRWAFRSFHDSWPLSRSFPGQDKEKEKIGASVVAPATVEAQPVSEPSKQ